MMLTFRNPGLMDLTAATTFGVSVKQNSNPIGFFGTGFKYAVAIVLRLGGRVTLHVGKDAHEFSIQPSMVRGEEFQVVCMDGKPLGFTTRMGINWSPWQAFRELYCNALDEGGDVHQGTLEPEDGVTTIHVSKLNEHYFERNKIVLPKNLQPVLKDENMEIFPGPSKHVHYRGVRVYELPRPSMFLYNVLADKTLTEDRTLKDVWLLNLDLAQSVTRSKDKQLMEKWLTAGKDYFEHSVDLNWGPIEPSAEFLDTVAVLRRKVDRPINLSSLSVFIKYRDEHFDVEPVALSEIELKQLDRALAFLKRIGHDIDRSSIRPVESLGDGVLGQAMTFSEQILIARRTFEMGTKYVAGTVLEEHIHLKRKYRDCTREFQNYLIDQVITIGERLIGEPL